MMRVLALLVVLVFAGCVTEVRRPRSPRPLPKEAAIAPSTPVALPDGAIAQPATTAQVLNSHIRVALQPIGEIPFDGQTLPVLSPDGTFMATQVGPTPSWSTILGEEGAPLASTRIERYELTESGPRALGTVEAAVGTLLGQYSTGQGFIASGPDNARTGRFVPWLANAAPAPLPDELASAGSSAKRLSQGSVLYPLRCSPLRYAWLELDSQSALWIVVTDPLQSDISPMPRRRLLAHDATGFTAYQAFATVQGPVEIVHDGMDFLRQLPGFLFFHPGAERMAIYVFATTDIVLLEKNSIAGAWFAKGDRWGVFLTTPEGLQFQALGVDSRGVLTVGAAARVLNEAYVPRSTSDPEHPYVLIGPGSSGNMLRLLWMQPMAE